MSLKAKIEAVIYASQEPVTLVQLAGLLGQEAQRELEELAARQHSLHLASPAEVPETQTEPQPEGGPASQPEGGPPTEPEADSSLTTEATAAEKRQARERERKLREYLREIVDHLIADYATSERGLEVREVAGGFRMATKPEYHDAVRGFIKSLKPPLKLSLQALETLAVVAYKQPVTAPEISEIRGVDSGGVLGSLMARKLITTAGRKQVIGRPILYKTTKDFLLRFGLRDVSELPSIEEFEKMANELAEQEEIDMPHNDNPHNENLESAEERITHENLEEEKHATAPQADGNNESLDSDESNRPNDELPAIDGRMSGLPPQVESDPSADEAAIQNEESGA